MENDSGNLEGVEFLQQIGTQKEIAAETVGEKLDIRVVELLSHKSFHEEILLRLEFNPAQTGVLGSLFEERRVLVQTVGNYVL